MNLWTTAESPLGALLLTGVETENGVALTALSMAGQRGELAPPPEEAERPGAFTAITAQLRDYFAGAGTGFDVELRDAGTPFQRRVWDVLDTIPYGVTVTYGEVTARAGLPRERVRAVAAAIGANPIPVIRPCHRVIGANGALTGYVGGLERKQRLLALEGVLLAA